MSSAPARARCSRISTMPAAQPSLARWISRVTDGSSAAPAVIALASSSVKRSSLQSICVIDWSAISRAISGGGGIRDTNTRLMPRGRFAQPLAERVPPRGRCRRFVEVVDDNERLRREQREERAQEPPRERSAARSRTRGRIAAVPRAVSAWRARCPRRPASDSGRKCPDRHPRHRPGTRRRAPCAPRCSSRSASTCPRPAGRRSRRSGARARHRAARTAARAAARRTGAGG